jgi:cyclic pyranopterin phosphate synthase
MMPIGYGSSFAGMPQEKIMNLVEQKFGKMIPYNGKPLGNGPCTYYTVDGFEGKIGFISAISHKFCSQCNRIRLTSQGYLKTCLQYTAGRDLRAVLRNGGTDEELKDRIRAALAEKPDGHHFREKAKEDDTESLCMSQIGG